MGSGHPQLRVLEVPASRAAGTVDLLVQGPERVWWPSRRQRAAALLVFGGLTVGVLLVRSRPPGERVQLVLRPGASVVVYDVVRSGPLVDVQLQVELRNDGARRLEVLGARLEPPSWQVSVADRPIVVPGETLVLQFEHQRRCDRSIAVTRPRSLALTVLPDGARRRTLRLPLAGGDGGPALARALLDVPAAACAGPSPARSLGPEHPEAVAR